MSEVAANFIYVLALNIIAVMLHLRLFYSRIIGMRLSALQTAWCGMVSYLLIYFSLFGLVILLECWV